MNPPRTRASALAVVAASLWLGQDARPPLPVATTIVVSTAADAINGATSSVAGLLASPGADGISLREAIAATNNDPGYHTIQFSSPLVIQLGSALPPLTGGHVTLRGPATIRGGAATIPTPYTNGLQVASSGNRLTGITIDGFFLKGVLIAPPDGNLPTGVTIADNTIDSITIQGVRDGIVLGDVFSPTCGSQTPCDTRYSYLRTTVLHNTVEAARFAIHVDLIKVNGDLVDSTTIQGNTIRSGTTATPNADGAPIQINVGGVSLSSRIARLLIADNTIESVQAGGDGAIMIANGLQRARSSVIEDVRITGNRVHVIRPNASVPCCHGIMVSAGSDYFTYAPSLYSGSPDDNVVRRVEVSGNVVSGDLKFGGMRVQAGADGGGSRNRVEAVRLTGNTIVSNLRSQGILVWVGQVGRGLTVTGNEITDVDISDNGITTGDAGTNLELTSTAGIALLAGQDGGRDGTIRNVRITNNRITTGYAGIRLIGGMGSDPPPQGNSIRCVRIQGNTITGAAIAIYAQANLNGASGNSVNFLSDSGTKFLPEITSPPGTLTDEVVTGC